MSQNMPILWQNALSQFSTTIAQKAWVWFAETRGTGMLYQADNYAMEVERLLLSVRPKITMADKAYQMDEETLDDLLRFILKRHVNYRLGGDINPPFLNN